MCHFVKRGIFTVFDQYVMILATVASSDFQRHVFVVIVALVCVVRLYPCLCLLRGIWGTDA